MLHMFYTDILTEVCLTYLPAVSFCGSSQTNTKPVGVCTIRLKVKSSFRSSLVHCIPGNCFRGNDLVSTTMYWDEWVCVDWFVKCFGTVSTAWEILKFTQISSLKTLESIHIFFYIVNSTKCIRKWFIQVKCIWKVYT